MRKMLPVKLLAVVAIGSSAGLAMLGTTAGAATKPPVTVTCTGLFGNSTQELQSGCTTTTKAKITPYAVSIPNSGDNGATIYWTNKETTTISFSLAPGSASCGTELGQPASLVEAETSTVTGGTSGLTKAVPFTSDACVYVGSDGSVVVIGSGSSEL